MWGLLLVSWPGQDGCCPQGADGPQAGTSCLGAELYFLLDGHLSNCRVTASRTVQLNHAWSPHGFYPLCLPIKSWLQIFSHICPWVTAEVPMCPWTALEQSPAQGSWQDVITICQELREIKEGAKQFAFFVLVPETSVPFVGFTHFLICRSWGAS